MRGLRNRRITTTIRMDAAMCAAITRKSSGGIQGKWDAPWREPEAGKFGSATTIRQATWSASGRTRNHARITSQQTTRNKFIRVGGWRERPSGGEWADPASEQI